MMRALSLTQPWTSLMAWGEKRYETRGWSTAIRGEVALASSKGFPREARELCHTEPFASVLRAHGSPPVERAEGCDATGRPKVKSGGALGFYTLSPACEAAVRAQIPSKGAREAAR